MTSKQFADLKSATAEYDRLLELDGELGKTSCEIHYSAADDGDTYEVDSEIAQFGIHAMRTALAEKMQAVEATIQNVVAGQSPYQ